MTVRTLDHIDVTFSEPVAAVDAANLDGDGAVDIVDFGRFVQAFTGPVE